MEDLSEDFVGIVGIVGAVVGVGVEGEEVDVGALMVDAAALMVEEVGVEGEEVDAAASIAGEYMVVVVVDEGEAVIKTLIQYSDSKFFFWFIISLP